MLENVYEVVVVGAGPHTLSLLTKLLVDVQDKYEERPSNSHLFSYKNGTSVCLYIDYIICGSGLKR